MNEKNTCFIVMLLLIIMLLGGNLFQALRYRSAVRSGREQSTELQKRLDNASSINKELAGQLESNRSQLSNARGIVEQLNSSIKKQSGSIDETINLVRIIRKEVANLEDCLDSGAANNSGADNSPDN